MDMVRLPQADVRLRWSESRFEGMPEEEVDAKLMLLFSEIVQ
jgi:hypothetical protein